MANVIKLFTSILVVVAILLVLSSAADVQQPSGSGEAVRPKRQLLAALFGGLLGGIQRNPYYG